MYNKALNRSAIDIFSSLGVKITIRPDTKLTKWRALVWWKSVVENECLASFIKLSTTELRQGRPNATLLL